MPSLSTSQIERLGVRLVQDAKPAEADLELLHRVLGLYSDGIRYGEPPARWWTPTEFDAMDAVLQQLVTSSYDLRTISVELALAVAEMIDAVETGEAMAPEDPELDAYRQRVDDALVELRTKLEDV